MTCHRVMTCRHVMPCRNLKSGFASISTAWPSQKLSPTASESWRCSLPALTSTASKTTRRKSPPDLPRDLHIRVRTVHHSIGDAARAPGKVNTSIFEKCGSQEIPRVGPGGMRAAVRYSHLFNNPAGPCATLKHICQSPCEAAHNFKAATSIIQRGRAQL